jgi:hypothetical protein
MIRQFLDSLINLFRWFKTMWKDRDWDSYFVYEILKRKLVNMKEHFEYHDNDVHTMKYLKLSIKLLERIQGEHYLMEWNQYATINTTVVKVPNTITSTINMEVSEERFVDYFTKYKYTVNSLWRSKLGYKAIFGIKSDLEIAMSLGVHNHNKAKRLLFKILDNNLESWSI